MSIAIQTPLMGCTRAESTRHGRFLVAAIGNDPGHLNPAITTNGSVHMASSLLFDGLLTLDDDLLPRPALAERWAIEEGGARYRFHLRRGVRWHDGRPFTSADVKFTFDSLLLRFHARTRASLAPALQRIVTPDDTTVVFEFRRPYAPLLQQLDVIEAPILPRHVFGGSDPLRHPANIAPIGTGPFRFVSYRANGEIRYEANREYFLGAPTLSGVVLRIVPDGGTQVMALEAGEVDWLFSVPGPELKRLQRSDAVRLFQTTINPGGSNCISVVGFNLERPWFRDVRVRRAVAHAIHRGQFLDRILYGEGRVADAPISSRIEFAHAKALPVLDFDPQAASSLLAAVGWQRVDDGPLVARRVAGMADGTRFVVNLKVMPGQAAYGDLLRAQLRVVGVDLRVEPLEPAVYSQVVFTARDFDTAVGSYCNGTDPEIGVRRMLVSSSIGPVPFSNMAGYRNRSVDSLFDLAGAELDVDMRSRLYREIQALAVRDQPYVWLVETAATRAHSVRCHGFRSAAHFAATARCGE